MNFNFRWESLTIYHSDYAASHCSKLEALREGLTKSKSLVPKNHEISIIYLMAFIGGRHIFYSAAHNFAKGALGVGKALLWPAVLIYKAPEFLKM
ncbi:hypothetical protein [Daejeonella lutea]|uniref:Uncharacterized protein n=1 Tax=Daejeonella lutea TaxID=572036 RepID=A0A1T4ZXH2_9SPHI|nr:hypothetical protein [Daejeonella lutea]SKB27227.1 hypothetical protein SAMN05661099_0037 [Daejeonella lutea]